MNARFLILLALPWLLLISCSERGKNAEIHKAPKVVEARGNVVPQDSMAEPYVIQVDQSKLRKVPAGMPVKTPANTNIHPAGSPKIFIAGPPRICVPGKDGFRIPSKVRARPRVIKAGMPQKITIKDAFVKDQNPGNFSIYGKLQGLNNSIVRSLIQDKDRSLWIATGSGASKFDGHQVWQYTTNEGLPNDKLGQIFQDKQGNLWFGFFEAGACKFDGKNFTLFGEKEGLAGATVFTIHQDRQGNLWFGTSAGVSKYDGKHFTTFTPNEGLSGVNVHAIYEDRKGNLWFGSEGGGVCRYDGNAFYQYTLKEGFTDYFVMSIREDQSGNFWFGTYGGGVFRFDGSNFFQFTMSEGLCSDFIQTILEDRNGTIWIGTEGGGACSFDGKTFTHFTTNEGLPDNVVLSILEDNDGNLWFGTYGGGICKYAGQIFTHISEKEGISNKQIFSCLEDSRGSLWFGTWQFGVNKYDSLGFSLYTIAQGLPNNEIFSMLEDRAGNIWFGTWNSGISRYDGKHFTNFSTKDGLSYNTILSLLEDKKGNIWIGTYGGGISKFDGLKFTNYNTKNGLADNAVFSIIEDRHGNIWMGTEKGGVSKFSPGKNPNSSKGQFVNFTVEQGLPNNTVYSLVEDFAGNIWIGTEQGVCVFDGKKFTIIGQNEGLSNACIMSLLVDRHKNLYLGTRKGLNRISAERLPVFLEKIKSGSLREDDVFFKQFNYDQGFLGMGVNRGKTMLEDRTGTIWIATNDRLTAFHPKGVMPDTAPPNIQLNEIQLFNEQIEWQSLQGKNDSVLLLKNGMQVGGFLFSGVGSWGRIPENLSLAWNSNYLTFHYSGITMNQPNQVKYQYMLKGIDENWNGITLRREATYGNIPPGTYTFLVKAMNSEGVWSKPFTYSFTIRRPWWQNWWAYGLYALAFLAGIRLYVRWRGQIIRSKVEMERAKAKEAFLANMSHEVRTPLNAIIGFNDLLKRTNLNQEQEGHVKIIGNALNNLNVIINDILDYSKLESGRLDLEKRPFRVGSLLRQVAHMHKLRAEAKKLKMLVSIDPDIPEFVSGDETRLSQMLINLVSNALKFTSRGSIEIKVRKMSEENGRVLLRFGVRDTGIGIDPAKLDMIFERFIQAEDSTTRLYGGTGLGLNIVKSLVDLHHGKLQVESTPGEGSEFSFEISYPVATGPQQNASIEIQHPPAILSQLRILLIEDNDYNQMLAKIYLERNAAVVDIAGNGLIGLNFLASQKYDAVLMDIQMPELDGYLTTERIRKDLKLDIPIIGCSAHAMESEKNRCMEVGMNDYIIKPYSEQDLVQALVRVLE